MRNETVDITKRVLDFTENFYKPILGGGLEMARAAYVECCSAYATLYNFLASNPPQKNSNGYIAEFPDSDDRTVIYNAANVIVLRIYTLNDYVIALDAYKNKDFDRDKIMMDACSAEWQKEHTYRLEFLNRYGY